MSLDTSHLDAGWTDPRDALVAEMAQDLYDACGCTGADSMARLLDYAEGRVPLADGSLLLCDADIEVLSEELTEADWTEIPRPELPIRDDEIEVVEPRRSAAERRGHVRRWLSVAAGEKTLTAQRTMLDSTGQQRRPAMKTKTQKHTDSFFAACDTFEAAAAKACGGWLTVGALVEMLDNSRRGVASPLDALTAAHVRRWGWMAEHDPVCVGRRRAVVDAYFAMKKAEKTMRLSAQARDRAARKLALAA
jgi:hypothetical protein